MLNTNVDNNLNLKISKLKPINAVGLGYFQSPKINPETVINLLDNSNKLIGNSDVGKVTLNFNNTTDIFKFETSNNIFEIEETQISETKNISLTDVFYIDEENVIPLYFKSTLKYPIKTKKIPNLNEFKFVDSFNRKVELEHIKIIFTNIEIFENNKTVASDLYYVSFYFEKNINNMNLSIQYNAYVNSSIQYNYKELLDCSDSLKIGIDFEMNFQDREVEYDSEIVIINSPLLIMKEHLRFKDLRNLIPITYVIETEAYTTDPVSIDIINPNYALSLEELNIIDTELGYDNDVFFITKKTPKQLVFEKSGLGIDEFEALDLTYNFKIISEVDSRINDQVRIVFEKDKYVFAKVYCNTGYGYDNQMHFNDVFITKYDETTDSFLKKYSAKINDLNPIKLNKGFLNFSDPSWHIKIDYGYFETKINNNTYCYVVEEYNQDYYKELGLPYELVRNEKVIIISNNMIKVKNKNMLNYKEYPFLYKINSFGIKEKINIKKIDYFNGIINADINKNDIVFIDYIYKKDSYEYKGYFDNIYKKFFYLDLKPTVNNYSTMSFMNNKDVNNLNLINKKIYIYIRPKYVIDSGVKSKITTFNHHIFHSFKEIIDETVLLLGTIIVSPNVSKGDVEITDIRQRGGGIKEEFIQSISVDENVNLESFWDTGYWNGTPFYKNNVFNINIDEKILTDNGGKFNKKIIKSKIDKWRALGNFPIVNYVKGYNQKELDFNIKIEKDILNKNDFVFYVELETINTIPAGQMYNTELYRQFFKPDFEVKIIDDVIPDYEINSYEIYNWKSSVNYNTTVFEEYYNANEIYLYSEIYDVDELKDSIKNNLEASEFYDVVLLKNLYDNTYTVASDETPQIEYIEVIEINEE